MMVFLSLVSIICNHAAFLLNDVRRKELQTDTKGIIRRSFFKYQRRLESRSLDAAESK